MARKGNHLLSRHYLRLHLWLRHWCERLTIRQRKAIVCGLSFVYLICCLWMIAQFFLPPKEERLSIPKGTIIDSNIHTDNVFIQLYQRYSTNSNENG